MQPNCRTLAQVALADSNDASQCKGIGGIGWSRGRSKQSQPFRAPSHKLAVTCCRDRSAKMASFAQQHTAQVPHIGPVTWSTEPSHRLRIWIVCPSQVMPSRSFKDSQSPWMKVPGLWKTASFYVFHRNCCQLLAGVKADSHSGTQMSILAA